MVGRLVFSFFCRDATPRWLEVWAFPDGTLNLVAAAGNPSTEHVFPCAPAWLRRVAAGKSLTAASADGEISLTPQDEEIVVTVQNPGGGEAWEQRIPRHDFEASVDDITRALGD